MRILGMMAISFALTIACSKKSDDSPGPKPTSEPSDDLGNGGSGNGESGGSGGGTTSAATYKNCGYKIVNAASDSEKQLILNNLNHAFLESSRDLNSNTGKYNATGFALDSANKMYRKVNLTFDSIDSLNAGVVEDNEKYSFSFGSIEISKPTKTAKTGESEYSLVIIKEAKPGPGTFKFECYVAAVGFRKDSSTNNRLYLFRIGSSYVTAQSSNPDIKLPGEKEFIDENFSSMRGMPAVN